MTTTLIALGAFTILNTILLFFQLKKIRQNSGTETELLLEKINRIIREESLLNRDEMHSNSQAHRQELSAAIQRFSEEFIRNTGSAREELSLQFKQLNDSLSLRFTENSTLQKETLELFSQRLETLTSTLDKRFELMSSTLKENIYNLQNENNKRLDKIHDTVDEKLHKTLEDRLGHSFKLVSEHLEKVQKGLGEMQNLATGVGDLKRVLTNVKTKGVLGEYQLANILEHLLIPSQYSANVKTKKGSDAHVEFAIKLPGKDDTTGTVWIPVDSKFPTHDYQELINCYEMGDKALIEKTRKKLSQTITAFAREISAKYIDPPNTTDFAIMFLPIEGLYAEVLRTDSLFQNIQQEHKIIIAGPTTLSALLSSLQMGFRTLAIEKRSSEVWEVLGAVKTEFNKFGGILDKTQKKLDEASKTIQSAGIRTRAIQRTLRDVEELPDAQNVISSTASDPLEQALLEH